MLFCRDSYLEHVKNGIKPDTYNQLRNAPLFGHGLFPDAVIQQSRILQVITPPVLFPDPVRVLPNRPDGDLLTGSIPMKEKRVKIPVP